MNSFIRKRKRNGTTHANDPFSMNENHYSKEQDKDTTISTSTAKHEQILKVEQSSLLYSLHRRSILSKPCRHLQLLRRKFKICFSKLDTPVNEAVLALDRGGSYLISLGDRRIENHDQVNGHTCTSLTISFYATPSRHRLEKNLRNPCVRALSIPLTSDNEHLSCAQTPVKILISSDGCIGVAMYKENFMRDDSDRFQENDDIGSMVLFLPPNHCISENNVGVYTRYSNISLTALMNSHTIRNLLWKTSFVPYRNLEERRSHQESKHLTLHVRKSSSAYVLFLDEEDDFLIHWIDFDFSARKVETFLINGHSKEHASFKKTFCHDDPYNVYNESFQNYSTASRPMIVHRAILNIGIILDDIISNRPALFGKQTVHFKYAYTLISFHSDGRTVGMVLSFTNPNSIKDNKTKTQAFAIIVSIDIFSQNYKEIQWFLHSNCTETRGLQNWSNKIALHKRMLDMNIGPYCFAPNRSKQAFNQIKVSTHEENVFDPRDWDKELWKNATPKKVAMASLYNNCDVFTNDAILNRTPVQEISARDFPVHISYS